MTEISDDAAETLWASSEEGKSVIQEAMARAESMGFGDTPSYVIGAACWIAARAAGKTGDAEAPGHEHRWLLLGAQGAPPVPVLMGTPVPRIAVLVRCRECGLPDAFLLPGTWSLADLTAHGSRP